MSKTWIIILSIFGAFILLAIIGIGAGVYWVTQNKDKFLDASRKSAVEGREFGKHTDQNGCMQESLSRAKKGSSFSGSIALNFFLTECLATGKPSPGFCDGVPPTSEMIKSVQWSTAKCKEAGVQAANCSQLFQMVQAYCDRKTRDKPQDSEDQKQTK